MATRVEGLMTRDVVSVPPGMRFGQIVRLFRAFGIGAAPVVDGGGRVLGIVCESDLVLGLSGHSAPQEGRPVPDQVRRERKEPAAATAAGLMSVPAMTVGPDTSPEQAADLMRRHRVKRLPVVDGGVLVGIVSRSDLAAVHTRPDSWIRAAVEEQIRSRPSTGGVRVTVAQGVVALRGRVPRRSVAFALRRVARRVEGVVRVDDRLDYTVDDLSPLASARIPR